MLQKQSCLLKSFRQTTKNIQWTKDEPDRCLLTLSAIGNVHLKAAGTKPNSCRAGFSKHKRLNMPPSLFKKRILLFFSNSNINSMPTSAKMLYKQIKLCYKRQEWVKNDNIPTAALKHLRFCAPCLPKSSFHSLQNINPFPFYNTGLHVHSVCWGGRSGGDACQRGPHGEHQEEDLLGDGPTLMELPVLWSPPASAAYIFLQVCENRAISTGF